MANNEIKLLIFSFFGFFIGVFIFFNGFKKFKEKKLIENTPTSKIRSIAMGRVEIYGEVLPYKKILKSPFSNQDCVYCRWIVEEYKRTNKSSSWQTIASGEIKDYFYVKDDTGSVLIDPNGAEIDIPKDYESNKINETIKSFLIEKNIIYKGLLFNKTLRFKEYFLSAKDKIYVMGTAGDNPFVEDGKSLKNETDIMIQKGNKDSFFYISDKDEKKVISNYNWKIIGNFFLGCFFILISLFYIFYYFGIL